MYGHISSSRTILQIVRTIPWCFLQPLESLLLPSHQDTVLHQGLDHSEKSVLVIVCKEEGLSLGFGST